jgi:hypothetical protein
MAFTCEAGRLRPAGRHVEQAACRVSDGCTFVVEVARFGVTLRRSGNEVPSRVESKRQIPSLGDPSLRADHREWVDHRAVAALYLLSNPIRRMSLSTRLSVEAQVI